MVKGKRACLIAAVVVAAAGLGSCYLPLPPSNPPFRYPTYYFWNGKAQRYDLPFNTWAENPRIAEELRKDHAERNSSESLPGFTLHLLGVAGFSCAPSEAPEAPGEAASTCPECNTCIK